MMDMNFNHKGLYGKVNWLYSLAAVLLVDWHKVLAPSGNFSPQGEREGGVGRKPEYLEKSHDNQPCK